jgi:hypothetical protein
VRVLRGADPGQIPITSQVPTLLVVNTQALEGVRDSWRVPDDLLRRADVVVDGAGIHRKRSAAVPNLADGSDNQPQDAVAITAGRAHLRNEAHQVVISSDR